MAEDAKTAQLRELLKKSLKYIVANLEVMEKEVFIAAAKAQHEQFKKITKVIMDIATVRRHSSSELLRFRFLFLLD
jgi:hypothetical protein